MSVMTVWRSRFQGTYYTYTPVQTKGPRARNTYRGARRNVGRNTYNTRLREKRKAWRMTRREYDAFSFVSPWRII
jgi:hypothetical protein